MELEGRNISYSYKGKKLLNGVSFRFVSSNIIGITGMNKTLFLEIIDLEKKHGGQLIVNGEVLKSSNRMEFQRQIALIKQGELFFTTTVEEEMRLIVDYYQYTNSDLHKRMVDSLKMAGLSSEYLKRKIITLSSSEKYLVKLACHLLMNPKVLLFDEAFALLDYNFKKRLMKLLRKLRDKKDKLIIIASNDVDFLYEFTDKLFILEKGKVLRYDDTITIFKDTSFLNQNNMDVPYLIQFTDLARKKNVRLSYHKDILDLIKDVYKHV